MDIPVRERLSALLRHPSLTGVKRFILLLRGVFFIGLRYRCPCCRWRVRSFVSKGSLIRKSETGYCPRCNAKARHRRIWLYLERHTDLFSRRVEFLEVAPWWALARRLRRLPDVRYVGMDIKPSLAQVTLLGDVARIPLKSGAMDAAICIHVLEHVPDDRSAMAELFRVLKPGGWILVSVPLRLDHTTVEDPSITDPEERLRRFGERGHVRFYGADIRDRLTETGFEIELDLGSDIPRDDREQYALRDDEHIFHCRKPLR